MSLVPRRYCGCFDKLFDLLTHPVVQYRPRPPPSLGQDAPGQGRARPGLLGTIDTWLKSSATHVAFIASLPLTCHKVANCAVSALASGVG